MVSRNAFLDSLFGKRDDPFDQVGAVKLSSSLSAPQVS
jgi:hypothetical protein